MSYKARSSDEMEQSTDIGLVKGHAYGITAVKRVALEGTGLFGIFNQDKIPMIRLRNPWGGCEWKGPFSDGYKFFMSWFSPFQISTCSSLEKFCLLLNLTGF